MFSSLVFLFIFLPVTLIIYFAIGKLGNTKITFSWLVVASLVFYGWWAPGYLGLMLISILFNYAIGFALGGVTKNYSKKWLLMSGIIGNLILLGYFKYANFFVNSLNEILSADYHLAKVILPLAISYYTLQQIAFLVDTYNGKTQEPNFLHYCLFVTFFPQLIAGPIVFHKEILPQFIKI